MLKIIVFLFSIIYVKAFYIRPNKLPSSIYAQTKVDFYEKPRKKHSKVLNEKVENIIYRVVNNDDYFSIGYSIENKQSHEEPIYTLIWFDCKECKELLEYLIQTNTLVTYINGSYYFYDKHASDNKPLLYKKDEYITDDIFEIYTELFNM